MSGIRNLSLSDYWWGWFSSVSLQVSKRWCCESAAVNMPANWKTQQWPQIKLSILWHTIALISHASKVMLNYPSQASAINELWTSRCSSWFRKGRWTRDQLANNCWIIEKPREFQKNMYFCFIDYAKGFDCGITINCGKFWKRWEYQTTWPASWEICIQVRKQKLELGMEQQTGCK